MIAGAHTGFGLVVGTGKVRFNTGLRLSLGLGLGSYSGGTVIGDQSVRWNYVIGGLRGVYSAGVEFR